MSVESTAPERRATGPRTAAGKRRSRMNAIKHGLCSKHLLLEGENPAEYAKLHRRVWDDWQPVGVGEMLEVEHLAGLYWVRRRGRIAVTALISRSPGFAGTAGRPDLPDPYKLRAGLTDGSTPLSTKVALLHDAVEKLYSISEKIAESDFEFDEVVTTLGSVYGSLCDRTASIPSWKILTLLSKCNASETRGREATDFVSEAIELIRAECVRFAQLLSDEKSKEVMFTSQASLILPQSDLDRIIRYESHLSREIDRSINRLRQMQRERRARKSTIRVDL